MSQSRAGRMPWEMVDVLILTALQAEYDAVLKEDVDALPGSSWERRMGPLGLEVALRTFRGQGGGTLRVAVTRLLEKVGVAPAYAAAPLVRVFSPRCLAIRTEGSALSALASRQDIPYRLVMKGTVEGADLVWSAKVPPMQRPQELVPSSTGDLEALLAPGTRAPPKDGGPVALLDARHASVDFFEPIHAELLQDLQSWCGEDEPVSVRLFHGAAGTGKTRLFIESIQRLRGQGWRAGFLHEAVEPDHFEELLAAASERPTLVVIDRAESLPRLGALLLSVAHRRKAGGPGRFRLALIAREAGGWWELLQRRSLELRKLLKDRLPTEVASIAPSQREAVFEHAAQRFASLLGRTPPASSVAISDPRFDRVLPLHMAALAAVLGKPFTPESLSEALLGEEGAFWGSRVEGGERPFQELVLRSIAAWILTGGASTSEDARALLLLRNLYPGLAAEAGHWEPELLGEALVLRALRREGASAGDWLKRILEGADARAARTAFEVLGRLSAEAPEAGEWIAALLAGAVSVRATAALEAAKAIGQRPAYAALGRELAKALEREGTPLVAELLEASGLPEFVAPLREVSVWVKTTLLNHLPPGETPRARIEQARFRGSLGSLLGMLGRREEALGFVKEAVEHYRQLAAAHPEVFRVDLALGLTDLGVVQGELGQREEALAAMQEAVSIRRTLAEESPREFLPILAVNLNGLARAQSALGRREEALASMQEAVSHYRALAKKRPESFLPELAASLNNLSSMQSALGHKAESQSSIHEAVGHYRTIAKKHPEPYLPELAGSLTNLAIVQGELGQREEALALAQESVALFRQLMEARIEEHLPPFATSLTCLAGALSALGRRDEALSWMLESVAIRRKLAEERPQSFLADLAMSLVNLSVFQNELGRREESLATVKEAAERYRKLAQAYSSAYLPALAVCLSNLAAVQSSLGRNAEALASVQEAVEYYRRLAKVMPAMFLSQLAASLNTLGSVQSGLELWTEALASVQEGVEIRRQLAQEQPQAGLPELALSLSNLGALLSAQGRGEEALAALGEAVDIRRRLAAEHPRAFRSDLATSLNNLGTLQGTLGRTAEALASVREAVGIRRLLAEEHPEAFRPELAVSVATLSQVQKVQGQGAEALASLHEALDIIWPFFLKLPTAFTAFTGTLFQELTTLHAQVGTAPPASLKERLETWSVMLEKARARMH
ncbi:tetratricopeptide repeat protein [Hyalangium minutum]|nr:tetratricopeptide repeat protein [Hyalangium minutum]